ncbi:MAG: flavin monoamine oxidase family protein, partial [Actinomycetota bacterium]
MSDRRDVDPHDVEHEGIEATEAAPIEGAPVPDPIFEVAGRGLEPGAPRKKVIVIGGGIAGLVSAYELKRAGHEVILLEAQNRVGGRVYTCRSLAPGLYAEYGAMRIPRVHELTLAYCQKFGLALRPFVMSNPKTLVYVGGQRMTMHDAEMDPNQLPFELAEHERGRTYTELWDEATKDVLERYRKEGESALASIIEEYDRYSIREFLQNRGWSEGAIELYGVMSFREANMNAAVIEQLREIVGRAFEDMQEIVGGFDLLPNAFYENLKPEIRFGANVHAIEQDDSSVTVHFKTESGRFAETADYAVCAIPFSILRDVEV